MVRVYSIDFGQRFGNGALFAIPLLFTHIRSSTLLSAYPRPGLGEVVLALSESIRFLTGVGWQKASKPGKMASARTA